MLKSLDEELRAAGARLQIVEARASVRDKLRTEGVENRFGRIDRFTSVADAVDAFIAGKAGSPTAVEGDHRP